MKQRVFFVANCVYGDHIAGGDVHFLNMARAIKDAGSELTFFGGHALAAHLQRSGLETHQILTDSKPMARIDATRLSGQMRLLLDYVCRFIGTMCRLQSITREDVVYAVTDYWFDALPTILSRARHKMMVLGMDAPTLKEIAFKQRPDVPKSRLTALYYWASQNLSLRLFRRCQVKRLFYVHPAMRNKLLTLGYRSEELIYISNGFDRETADKVSKQSKIYDIAWAGRPHRQKGIEDLLQTLVRLSMQIPNFKAVLIGQLESIQCRISELGLANNVHFTGYISEEAKFRFLKQTRAFIMPSTYESWGIVMAEALACEVPVIAYDLPAFRPIFGDLVTYIRCFDLNAFSTAAIEEVVRQRNGVNRFDRVLLQSFIKENSWETARDKFRQTMLEFSELR